MQIEIYSLTVNENNISVILEAVCDSFSSLLWDIEYYSCGAFMPFITDVVRPAVAEAIKSQKSRLANNMNFSRRQKRKLGLK